MADVVLPATTFAEREGTFTNMGITVQRLNQGIPPLAEAKSDWQIICTLAKKKGYPYSSLSTKKILSEIESVVPIYTGANYDRLKRKEFHWVSSFYKGNKPAKYTFDVIKPESLDIIKKNDFPFLLLTGASLNHQGVFPKHSKHLTLVAPECFLEMNEKDSEDMHIKDGDLVWVESAQNKLKLKTRVTQKSPKDVVFISEDYEWIPVN